MSDLPLIIAELEELIGLPAALQLVERWGGTWVYIPACLPEGHVLTEICGLDAARKLTQVYGRDTLRLPRCAAFMRARRDASIRAEHQAGRSARDLCLSWGVTERTVWRILADSPPKDDRQQTLL